MDGSVFITDVNRGVSRRITKKDTPNGISLPHACVFSPDGGKVGYLRAIRQLNQIFSTMFDECLLEKEKPPGAFVLNVLATI